MNPVSVFRFLSLYSMNPVSVFRFLSLYSMNPVSGSVDKRTTHIIVNTDEDLLAQRTLKYLQVN